jgi:hypothetical protein
MRAIIKRSNNNETHKTHKIYNIYARIDGRGFRRACDKAVPAGLVKILGDCKRDIAEQ